MYFVPAAGPASEFGSLKVAGIPAILVHKHSTILVGVKPIHVWDMFKQNKPSQAATVDRSKFKRHLALKTLFDLQENQAEAREPTALDQTALHQMAGRSKMDFHFYGGYFGGLAAYINLFSSSYGSSRFISPVVF